MCAFVNSAQRWDVGIFKWVNNVARLYSVLCINLLMHITGFSDLQADELSQGDSAILNFFFYIVCIFLHAGYQTSFPCRKKNIDAVALIF